MNAFSAYLLSLLVFAVAVFVQPPRATCPDRMFLDGVRVDGEFSCRPIPKPRPSEMRAPWHPVTELDDDELGEVHGRVYCSFGQRPVIREREIVSCEARH